MKSQSIFAPRRSAGVGPAAGLLAGVALLVFFPGPCASADPQQPAGQQAGKWTVQDCFKLLDTNGDGKLSPAELPNEPFFKTLDKDGDGFISSAELAAQAPAGWTGRVQSVIQNFNRLDKRGDGKLTPDEVPDAATSKRLDKDADGFITLNEAIAGLAAGSAGGGEASSGHLADPTQSFTPLMDLGKGTYLGDPGGLYPDGSNTPPPAYLKQGLAASAKIQPLDRDGKPAANGRVILLSIGMSNTTREFQTFQRMADADPGLNPLITLVDGAQGGADAELAKNRSGSYWPFVDQRIAAADVSGNQVQVVWLKEAIAGEKRAFPADANGLKEDLVAIIRILQARFANLAIVYVSSRTYAGYANTSLNPEPYAYESGFAVKWLVEDHIKTPTDGPWIAWGPYLWTDGPRGRRDKLTWTAQDVASDGTHPSPRGGSQKVASLLLSFLKTDPTSVGWFVRKAAP